MTDLFNTALNITALQAEIEQTVGDDVTEFFYLPSCQSTNTESMNLGRHRSVVLAEKQTAGRGRRGNNWYSPGSQNIYCSIGINKTIAAEYLGLISLVVGICIVESLQNLGVDDVSLKWPNDILLQGRKLGGVLIETRALSQDEFYLAIGFGLNINLTQQECDNIGQPAISLNQLHEVTFSRHQLLVVLVSNILQQSMLFEVDSIDHLIEQFNRFDSFSGKEVIVKTRTEEIAGVTLGLERTGWLKVQTEQGVQSFSAAEISLRQRV
ncbi:MAG: biotin--[acetyl-CoA-carboxylase] ligase [Gammaproteobacteria bacterium]|nr:biotin--[acetyl-CoA-carboxylase] ligase [Gammaproteobacteria bacterium]